MAIVAGVDVGALSDADLAALSSACSTESVRRSNLASIPAQVISAAQVFLAAGGDLSTLTTAIEGVSS